MSDFASGGEQYLAGALVYAQYACLNATTLEQLKREFCQKHAELVYTTECETKYCYNSTEAEGFAAALESGARAQDFHDSVVWATALKTTNELESTIL